VILRSFFFSELKPNILLTNLPGPPLSTSFLHIFHKHLHVSLQLT